MADSKIEWTEKTWNPVVGCSKVSPGCAHCYAETMDHRIRGVAGEEWKAWTPENAAYNVRLHPERLTAPLHWKKPCRVFVNSMSDLFHEAVPFEFIDRVFAVMALTPHITYQVLTKRPERMREYMEAEQDRLAIADAICAIEPMKSVYGMTWPLPNVWLGTSVENQHWADIRTPELLATPAAVRFLSCEPLLGPLDLTVTGHRIYAHEDRPSLFEAAGDCCWLDASNGIDWVIVGGESGSGARPCDLAWIRSIVQQCQSAAVPVFVKQIGSRVLGVDRPSSVRRWLLEGGGEWTPAIIGELAHLRPDNAIGWVPYNAKGGDMTEFPEDLRMRQFPEVSHA